MCGSRSGSDVELHKLLLQHRDYTILNLQCLSMQTVRNHYSTGLLIYIVTKPSTTHCTHAHFTQASGYYA